MRGGKLRLMNNQKLAIVKKFGAALAILIAGVAIGGDFGFMAALALIYLLLS